MWHLRCLNATPIGFGPGPSAPEARADRPDRSVEPGIALSRSAADPASWCRAGDIRPMPNRVDQETFE
jgi:hypothetical protein